MAIWDNVRNELEEALRKGGREFDLKRRTYLAEYESRTGRPLVVYATDFLNTGKVQNSSDIAISPYDKDGWVEVTAGLPDGPLDILLHSPGGSPQAAEWLITFLRRRFSPLRAVVPHTAKSAATMIALGCDEILMDDRGEMGPTDPQMALSRLAPAQAILDQFEKAQKDLGDDPSKLPAWIPILQQMGPSLLVEATNAIALAKSLIRDWLERFMFADDELAADKAKTISEWLGDHNNFQSHARMVSVDDLISRGVKVLDLRLGEHQALRDDIWRIWSAYTVTFDKTGAFKVFESSRGSGYIRRVQSLLVDEQGRPVRPLAPLPAASPPASRAERRRQGRK